MFYDFELYRDDVQEYVVEWLRGYWRDMEALAVRLGSHDAASMRKNQEITVETFDYLDGTTHLRSSGVDTHTITVSATISMSAPALESGHCRLEVDMDVRTHKMVPGDIGLLVSQLESISPILSGIEMRMAALERTLTDRFDLDLLDAEKVVADRRHRADRDLPAKEIKVHAARLLADKLLQLYIDGGHDTTAAVEHRLDKKERRMVKYIAQIFKHEHRRGAATRFTLTELGAACLRARRKDAEDLAARKARAS